MSNISCIIVTWSIHIKLKNHLFNTVGSKQSHNSIWVEERLRLLRSSIYLRIFSLPSVVKPDSGTSWLVKEFRSLISPTLTGCVCLAAKIIIYQYTTAGWGRWKCTLMWRSRLLPCGLHLKLKTMQSQSPSWGSDCDLFAIAAATSLCYGIPPSPILSTRIRWESTLWDVMRVARWYHLWMQGRWYAQ